MSGHSILILSTGFDPSLTISLEVRAERNAVLLRPGQNNSVAARILATIYPNYLVRTVVRRVTMHYRFLPFLVAAIVLSACTPAECATWQEYREAGQKARRDGHYAEAAKAFSAALAEAEKFGPDDHRLAVTLGNLGGVYWAQGKYAEAQPLFERAVAIDENALGPDHRLFAVSLYDLANLYCAMGKYEQAEPLFKRTIAIDEKAPAPNQAAAAEHRNGLAVLYVGQKKYSDAE